MKKDPTQAELTPSQHITQTIAGLTHWRDQRLAQLRELIRAAGFSFGSKMFLVTRPC